MMLWEWWIPFESSFVGDVMGAGMPSHRSLLTDACDLLRVLAVSLRTALSLHCLSFLLGLSHTPCPSFQTVQCAKH